MEHFTAGKEGKSGNVARIVLVVTRIDLLPSSLSPRGFEQRVSRGARQGGAMKKMRCARMQGRVDCRMQWRSVLVEMRGRPRIDSSYVDAAAAASLGIGLVKGEAILGVRTYEGVGVVCVMLCFLTERRFLKSQDLQCKNCLKGRLSML
ncbi:hypothetical protein POTOM_014698 [Populus tomentosa]|uniref:Uncharacterized protein n=1 Tax=Populus tomentosa TaxID=118781 RepID=A0A8X8A2G5_POPTO|nr:hypothetical protein POTOM_014698 [Populus tomentosa]